MQLTGLSRMTIYRLALAGRFPERRRLSENWWDGWNRTSHLGGLPLDRPFCGQRLAARLGYGVDLPVPQAREAKLRNDGKPAGMVIFVRFR
jgi:hypothetical protein